MSKLKTNTIQHTGGSADNITLDNSQNVTAEANLTVDGNLTVSGTSTISGYHPTTSRSNRNLIINGAMNVAQRGNVTGITASAYGGPDRFKYVDNSDVTVTINASGITSLSGFGRAYQVDITTADTAMASNHYAHIRQTIEGQDLQVIRKGFSDAKTLTLQFWVYTNKTGNYTVHMYDSDNTRHCSQLYSVSSANTWEKKTLTFPADTTGKLTNDNNASLEIDWNLAAGTNYTSGTLATSWASYTAANASAGLNVNLLDNTSNEFYLTGVQLEVGSVATDFEHISFGDELARCQRYYNKSYAYGTAVGTATTHGALVHSLFGAQNYAGIPGGVRYTQTMRTTPTITLYSTENANTTGKLTADSTDKTASIGYITETGFFPYVQNSSSSLAQNIFLRCQYQAEAEL